MKAKKIMSLAMVATLGLSSFAAVGCDRGNENSGGGDPDKTQITVGVYEGGFGGDWAFKAAERFEAIYGDTVIEAGKTGIEIDVKVEKQYNGPNLAQSVSSWDKDIYFTELLTSYNTLAKQGAFLEITDIATEQLTAYNETKSLEDKMNTSYRDWFKTDTGKYYAVPYYEGAYTLNYDIDLFEEECLFFAENGTDFIATPTAKKSAGPDNEFGTIDDGLPATYDDFFRLLNRMDGKSITPMLWSGRYQHYFSQMMMSLWADYEGANASAHFNFNGEKTIKVVDSFDGNNKPVLKDETITPATGYKAFQQAGIYHALDFAERIIDNELYYNYTDCFGSLDNLGAQEKYLYSKPSGSPIGILVEGTWWYNEAKTVFDDLADDFGESQRNRRFGVMTLPKATSDKVGEKQTLYDILCSSAFINAKISSNKIEMAKKFLQFCFTEESCREFTKITSTTLPYSYKMTDDDLAETSDFGQRNYKIHETSTYFLPVNQSPIFLSTPSLAESPSFWQTVQDGNVPTTALDKGTSAKAYFQSIGSYYSQDRWTKSFYKD